MGVDDLKQPKIGFSLKVLPIFLSRNYFIDLKRQSDYSGLCPCTSSLVNIFLSDDRFIAATSFAFKVMYGVLCGFVLRLRYYFAWKLGQSICYAAGFGFSGWTEDGKERWELVRNGELTKVEVRKQKFHLFPFFYLIGLMLKPEQFISSVLHPETLNHPENLHPESSSSLEI